MLTASVSWGRMGGGWRGGVSFAQTGKGKLILFCFHTNKNDLAQQKLQAEEYGKGRLRKHLVTEKKKEVAQKGELMSKHC